MARDHDSGTTCLFCVIPSLLDQSSSRSVQLLYDYSARLQCTLDIIQAKKQINLFLRTTSFTVQRTNSTKNTVTATDNTTRRKHYDSLCSPKLFCVLRLDIFPKSDLVIGQRNWAHERCTQELVVLLSIIGARTERVPIVGPLLRFSRAQPIVWPVAHPCFGRPFVWVGFRTRHERLLGLLCSLIRLGKIYISCSLTSEPGTLFIAPRRQVSCRHPATSASLAVTWDWGVACPCGE